MKQNQNQWLWNRKVEARGGPAAVGRVRRTDWSVVDELVGWSFIVMGQRVRNGDSNCLSSGGWTVVRGVHLKTSQLCGRVVVSSHALFSLWFLRNVFQPIRVKTGTPLSSCRKKGIKLSFLCFNLKLFMHSTPFSLSWSPLTLLFVCLLGIKYRRKQLGR